MPSTSIDFHQFEEILTHLTYRLPEIITKFSQKKPIMVFCLTQKACISTAKLLANWWSSNSPADRLWGAPLQIPIIEDKDLRGTLFDIVFISSKVHQIYKT